MLLSERESRVAVAALQTLERTLAVEIQQCRDPIEHGLPLPLRRALHRRDNVTNLARKLTGGGEHRVDRREIELTIRGLDRYVELLNEAVAEDEVAEDEFLASPQRMGTEIELRRSSSLLDKLAAD